MTKTEVKEEPKKSIAIDADSLAQLAQVIGEIDTQIASASGSDTAARKAFIDQLVLANAEQVETMSDGLVEQLSGLDVAILVGLMAVLDTKMKEKLVPIADTYIDAEFAKTKTDEKVDVTALRESRKALLGQFKALREVLNTFRIPNEHVPDPKRAGGGGRPVGGSASTSLKSGQNKEGYRYVMDGKKRPKSQNSFSSLAYYATEGVPKALGVENGPSRWGASELKTFMADAGIKFGEDDSWSIALPNGKTIAAARMTNEDLIEFGEDPNTSDPSEAPIESETPEASDTGAAA